MRLPGGRMLRARAQLAEQDDVAGIVPLAGSVRRGDVVLAWQIAITGGADGWVASHWASSDKATQ